MQQLSKRYRDQPQSPLERAVFWVEYVLRHGGAEHLRIAARDMSFIQLYFLDFWLLLVFCISVTVFLLVKMKREFESIYTSKNQNIKAKSQ